MEFLKIVYVHHYYTPRLLHDCFLISFSSFTIHLLLFTLFFIWLCISLVSAIVCFFCAPRHVFPSIVLHHHLPWFCVCVHVSVHIYVYHSLNATDFFFVCTLSHFFLRNKNNNIVPFNLCIYILNRQC